MIASLKQLLSNAVNYSGVLPPTKLNLREAVGNYVDFSHSKYAWMLGNFVIPYDQLSDLSNFADRRHQLKGPFSICVLGPETESLDKFKGIMSLIDKEIRKVHSGYPGEVRTNIMELKLPLASIENLNPEELVKALEVVVKSSSESRLLPHRVFFEVPGSFDAEKTKKVTKVIAVHNKSILKRKIDNYLFSGLKINFNPTNGSRPPSAKYLAEVLLYARDANVAVRFSGTENTPFPSYNYTIQSHVHGFINILTASMLAYTQDLNLEEMIEVLEDKNPENFIFKEAYLGWREWAAPVMEVKMLRMLSITSMNLSSFTPPIHGLKELGLIL